MSSNMAMVYIPERAVPNLGKSSNNINEGISSKSCLITGRYPNTQSCLLAIQLILIKRFKFYSSWIQTLEFRNQTQTHIQKRTQPANNLCLIQHYDVNKYRPYHIWYIFFKGYHINYMFSHTPPEFADFWLPNFWGSPTGGARALETMVNYIVAYSSGFSYKGATSNNQQIFITLLLIFPNNDSYPLVI